MEGGKLRKRERRNETERAKSEGLPGGRRVHFYELVPLQFLGRLVTWT